MLAASVETLRSCGVSNSKARYLRELAEFALVNNLEELSDASDDAVRATLTAIPGIGKWTCDMFLLFYLEREDVLPVENGAFRQAFNWLYGASVENEGVRTVVCNLWKPHSSTAVRYLYRALNMGLVTAQPASEIVAK